MSDKTGSAKAKKKKIDFTHTVGEYGWKLAASLLALMLVAATYVIYDVVSTMNSKINEHAVSQFAQLTLQPVLSAYGQPTVDVTAERVYLPELKVYLPLNDLSMKTMYAAGVSTEEGRVDYTASVSTRQILGSLPQTMDVSICTNPIWLETTATGMYEGEPAMAISLEDGRQLRIMKNNHACSNFSDAETTELLDLFAQVKSY